MPNRLFFDRQDYQLLHMINETIAHGTSADMEHQVFDANLHPHGILELTTTHEFRIAHAVVNLLGNLQTGKTEDRLAALRTLHDEVLHSARTSFRYNTGRVLIQIMKEIVRARGDDHAQLKLVRDFRSAASGNPRIVRLFLRRHHLLEMPEDWNQLTMDHHVHDANTKGRKNPTHLIMDAWIKGIRYLTVVYYNYVEPAAARELLESASIMGLSVRIGLEFRAPFRGRFISFVWTPRGFSDYQSFLAFLDEEPMQELIYEGHKVSAWIRRHVFATLNAWNVRHRPELEKELELELPVLEENAFMGFVSTGRPSFVHLAEFIHASCVPLLRAKVQALRAEESTADPDRAARIQELIRQMDGLTPETIMNRWLKPAKNPDLPSPNVPDPSPDAPKLLRLPPHVLMEWLTNVRSGYRITLQLADLTPEDVVELLWDCEGHITHLEMFNLKEWQDDRLRNLEAINALQIALNESSALHLKHMLRTMTRSLEQEQEGEECSRQEKFRVMLHNIAKLQAPYKTNPLGSRIGTDSTSHSSMRYGMGLAIPESLPPRAHRLAYQKKGFHPLFLPIELKIALRETFTLPARPTALMKKIGPKVRKLWGFRTFGLKKVREWLVDSSLIRTGEGSNVITMGGLSDAQGNGFLAEPACAGFGRGKTLGVRYLNTRFSNILKVLIGFIPAMLVFACTQDWWVLAWLGAPIWFVITGIRNIAQAVLGGGGVRRSSLLHWRDFIDWTRISDSLMYTGLSVVLLEWIIRDLLLARGMGLTTNNSPLLVFSIIAFANSLYIAGHNIFRGFPKEAIVGNIFRSVLAIPTSLVYNELLLGFFIFLDLPSPVLLLDQSAAITSKAASDTVAGLIEGFADARNNRRLRHWDYKTKLARFFDNYARLELRFSDVDILSLLSKPKEFARLTAKEAHHLYISHIVNLLDLMYFWMYQPYARQTLISLLRTMTREERIILARSQLMLVRVREVSQLFVDGLLGPSFAKALAFYLDSHEEYITEITRQCVAAGRTRRDRKNRSLLLPDREDDVCPACLESAKAQPAEPDFPHGGQRAWMGAQTAAQIDAMAHNLPFALPRASRTDSE